ncbi:hypothetical protein AALP_AAs69426U000100, partial [Arabis alpina]
RLLPASSSPVNVPLTLGFLIFYIAALKTTPESPEENKRGEGGGSIPVVRTGVKPVRVIQTGVLPAQVVQTGVLPAQVVQTGSLPAQVVQTGSLPAHIVQTGFLAARVVQAGVLPAQVVRTDFNSAKNRLLERAEKFGEISCEARKIIAMLSQDFIFDGCTILVHGLSRVVLEILKMAAQNNKLFRVLCT